MKILRTLLHELASKRYLIFQIAKRDFTQKYIDSYFGLGWAIIEPTATTLILTVVLTLGFKASLVKDIPFIIYMFSGMACFSYFSSATSECALVIKNYSYLVKKVNFPLWILPITKIISTSIVHFIMIFLLVILLFFYGYFPTIFWLQFFYYYLALSFFILSIAFTTSAVCVFVPDVKNIITIGLQFLFYLSPIFWSLDQLPAQYHNLLSYNPIVYIINGYRNSFIYQKPILHDFSQTIFFWFITMTFSFISYTIYRKIRPSFGDIL